MATQNGKIRIKLDSGTWAEAHAPVIVSASRSTDIPAFYSDWFFNRLDCGYSAWTNPFNGLKSYVSYSHTRFIVDMSKVAVDFLTRTPYRHTVHSRKSIHH